MKRSYRILLVHGELTGIESLRALLKAVPSQIDPFTHPKEALRRAREQQYDLVISDYAMPEMDGIALVKAIKKLKPEIRSIILSGYAHLGAVIRAMKNAEISQYVSKPWNDETLLKTISQVLMKDEKLTSLFHTASVRKEVVLKARETEGALATLERKFPGITQGAWEANKAYYPSS